MKVCLRTRLMRFNGSFMIEQVTTENELFLLFLIRSRQLLNFHHRNCHRTLIKYSAVRKRPKQGRECVATQVLCRCAHTLLTLLIHGCSPDGSNLFGSGHKKVVFKSWHCDPLAYLRCFTLTQYRSPRSPRTAGWRDASRSGGVRWGDPAYLRQDSTQSRCFTVHGYASRRQQGTDRHDRWWVLEVWQDTSRHENIPKFWSGTASQHRSFLWYLHHQPLQLQASRIKKLVI